jgi:hypothetical protein
VSLFKPHYRYTDPAPKRYSVAMKNPVAPNPKLKPVIDRLNEIFRGKASLGIEVYEPTYAIFSDGEIAVRGKRVQVGFRLGTDPAVVADVARALIGVDGCVFQEIPVFFGEPTSKNRDGIFFGDEAYRDYAKGMLQRVRSAKVGKSKKRYARKPKHAQDRR